MRTYIPCWDKIGITKERYLELLHFCRQYPEWLSDARGFLGIQGHAMDGQPHGTMTGDPVFNIAAKRERILVKIELVERCANGVGNGEWFAALIKNVCGGYPHSKIEQSIMPTASRGAFYQARKDFFLLLDAEMDKPAETDRDSKDTKLVTRGAIIS